MNNWIEIIQQTIYPPTCLLCDAPGAENLDLCKKCLESLPTNIHACPRCGIFLAGITDDSAICGKCLSHPPAFDHSTSLFVYEGPIRFLIHQLKFHRKMANARLIGELMARRLSKFEDYPKMLIPVPLHPRRFRQRGFNQAVEIAKPISRRLNIPLNTHCCVRTRYTTPQFELPAKQRIKNLKNAFVVNNPPNVNHIAIIDDIVTTATTVNELAMQFRKSGVEKVDIWSFARAPLN